MANFAKVHEKTQILNEDWKKLRVQPVQLMKPVSGHPFLKQVRRAQGTRRQLVDSSRGFAGSCEAAGSLQCVLSYASTFWDAEIGEKKEENKLFL